MEARWRGRRENGERRKMNRTVLDIECSVSKTVKYDYQEAIRNVNRTHYDLGDSISEEDLEFKGKSKTDFALNLICECSGYCVPDYIKSGLKWLNDSQ